jgi:predicted ATPase/signal transduction histidine kinase/tRNA A-37 threonylcarbamoyl transferase component Bud32
MLELPNYRLLERIHEGINSDVFLGQSIATGQNVAVKAARTGANSARKIAMIHHEHAIASAIDLPGVVRPIALEVGPGRAALVMEYAGTSLERLLAHHAGDLGVATALDYAIQVAAAIGGIHAARIIHKDVKPSNIIVDIATGVAKLSDFSISTVLTGERAPLGDFRSLEGTLQYLSPEQTGRMNRSIDYRTDFYSFGVTLFELTTGKLPFDARDPMQLVHAHIALQPPLAHTLNPRVPQCLSAVIAKLMAKTAEDRYQTAAHLQADLETCRGAVRTGVEPSGFVAAQGERSDRLQISQKLYGREDDVALLMAAFERVSAPRSQGDLAGQAELLLVAGYSGIGKSAIVSEVHRPITARHGYFVSGKFDQFNRNVPYASMLLAFQSLIRQLLTESEAELAGWKHRLQDALGANGQVIVQVIPEVELIIGRQPPLRELGVAETKNRFNLTFRHFIKVFATATRPLVLFLDDLQWADSASLQLIGIVLNDPEIRHLLIVGAYRDNEVDASHPLMITLSELGAARERVSTLTLKPLTQAHVTDLIADSLNASNAYVAPLAELAYGKTAGNPFFLIQLLTGLQARGQLQFSAANERWQWDLAALERVGISDNVVDLMVGKIQRLGETTQAVLQLAACVGNQFDLATLARLHHHTDRQTAEALWPALEQGLVVPLDASYKLMLLDGPIAPTVAVDAPAGELLGFRFLHDRVQQACYLLIDQAERGAIHLQLARSLVASTPNDHLDERIYDITSHLNLGAAGITEVAERYLGAELNLRAARRARTSTAYGPALECARAGLALLPADAWTQRYDLTLDLHNEVVDLEYLTLNFDGAEAVAGIVVANARHVLDRIRVYETRIQFYVGQNRMQLAIDTVKEVLEILEVPLTTDLPADHNPQLIAALPTMTDPRYIAAMRILMSSMPAVYIADPGLLPAVSFTMIRLTVEHGSTRFASYAASLYALIMGGVLGHFDVGMGFSTLALELLERFQATELESKVYALIFIFVHHWKRHVRETLEPLLHGVRVGIETGDVEYAGYNAVHYSTYYFFAGDELAAADARLKQYVELSAELKQEYGYQYIRIWRQLVIALRQPKGVGLAEVRHDKLVGEAFNEETDVEVLGQMFPVHFSMHMARTMLQYYYGDFTAAVASAQQAGDLLHAVGGFVSGVQHAFYQSLALLAVAPDLSAEDKAAALAKVEENRAKLQNWATHAPQNNQHKLDLVEAEMARVSGDGMTAVKLYEKAVAGARTHLYLHEEGLAYELAARFSEGLGTADVARHYRAAAYATYERWGAAGKCADMAKAFPYLALDTSTSRPQSSFLSTMSKPRTHASTATGAEGGTLDLITVVKSSQALASEIHLTRLLDKLMQIVMENVGAQTGVLLLERNGKLVIEAEADASTGLVRIDGATGLDASGNVPQSLVHYVERTRKPVVLNDALRDTLFQGDAYILANRPRSVLCAPIAHQGRFMGIFYFENNLSSGVFTDARLEVLGLLSAQVSISIENSKLYEELEQHTRTLEQKVEARTLELSAKNAELTESLERIQTMQQQIIVQEKLASLGTLTAGIAHELRNPLNFVNNFSDVAQDLAKELQQSVADLDGAADKERALLLDDITDLADNIRSTTERIHEHGHRASGIINTMLLHASNSRSDRAPVDVNELVASSVNLAYHGARAKDAAVELQIDADYDPAAGSVDMARAEVARVIINVVNNACYATNKKRNRGGHLYQPTLNVATRGLHDSVEIVLRDNGSGIAQAAMDKLFTPFFTTKPPGEGTGLGLSLSHDVIVQGHQGQMRVNSAEGEFAEFVIVLPRRAGVATA